MKQILFFGDSLTAGYGLARPELEAVPALIQQKIDAEGLAYRAVNAGLSGNTSAGGLKRLSYWLSSPVDVFVLELGINDLLRGIPPAVTSANLQEIISRVREAAPGVRIALMGMSLPQQLLVGRAAGFHQLYDRLADADPALAYVPFYLEGVAGQPQLNLRDGVHPNAAGYQRIAEHIWPTLKPLLIP
jgi:acyl-CoA thioesterase-1